MAQSPKQLDAIGKQYWKALFPNIQDTQNNQNLLAVLCSSYSAYWRAVQSLADQGEVITTDQGTTKLNPLNSVLNHAHDRIIKTSKALGLVALPTPDATPANNPIEEFFAKAVETR